MFKFVATFILGLSVFAATNAGEADVLDVNVKCTSARVCRFDVTIRHDDDGWEHYANQWEIRSPEDKRLGTRVLQHPHDTEQPFTRSLGDVEIPESITEVTVRARDSRHKYGGEEFTVSVP